MPVNNPDRAFFWDETNKVWRPALVGDPGELVWNSTTKCWEPGTIGAEYKWNASTRSWDFGPGGQYVRNTTTKTWEKVRSPGYGGPFYWDESTKSWLKNTDAAQVSDAFARWDFINNQAWWNGAYVGGVSSTPNWTFTRASTGYAQTSGGVLVPFASGELRRTDKGVLIEGAGTNLCLQSQTFDNASWTKTNASITADAAVAPDGTTTADALTEDTSVIAVHRAFTTATTTAAAYTVSVYIKPNGRTRAYIRLNNNVSANLYSWFLLTGAGSVTSSSAGSSGTIAALANGWYRCTHTVNTALAGTNIVIFGATTADAVADYTGDGASGLYLWGAQLEATAYASSYVVTTTASATRAADSLTVTGVSGLDYPLTLYAEWESAVDTAASRGVFWAGASDSNRTYLRLASNRTVRAVMTAGGAEQGAENPGVTTAVGSVYKQAGRSNTDDIKAAISGTLSAGDTTATKPSAPTKFYFGNIEVGTEPFYGYLRRAAIFSRALSDAELQALTS